MVGRYKSYGCSLYAHKLIKITKWIRIFFMHCVVIFFGIYTHTSNAHATIAPFASIESLTQQADCVVHAQVTKQWSEASDNAQQSLYTYSQVIVKEAWKGHTPTLITIRQLGGKVGEMRLHVEGDAELKVGQEIFLFLHHDPQQDLYFIISLAQGVFYTHSTMMHQVSTHDQVHTEDQNHTASIAHDEQRSVYQKLQGLSFYNHHIHLSTHSHHIYKTQPQHSYTISRLKQQVLAVARQSTHLSDATTTPKKIKKVIRRAKRRSYTRVSPQIHITPSTSSSLDLSPHPYQSRK